MDDYQYLKKLKGNTYVVTVDVARGVDKDYSAFIIYDVTQIPYKVVATFRNNELNLYCF